MIQSPLCNDVELYVLDGLDEQEKAKFESHLTECVECQQKVLEFGEITAELLSEVAEQSDVEPPIGMKSRVLNHVIAQPQESISKPVSSKKSFTPTWYKAGLSTAAAVILILGFQNWGYRQQLAFQEQQIQELGKIVATISMQTEGAFTNVKGTVLILSDGTQNTIMVKTSNLPKPSNGQQLYTLWVKDQNGVINGGSFLPASNGVGLIAFPISSVKPEQVMISLEPDAYSGNTPRGSLVLVGSL